MPLPGNRSLEIRFHLKIRFIKNQWRSQKFVLGLQIQFFCLKNRILWCFCKKKTKILHFILYIDWVCKCPFAPFLATQLLKIALLFLDLLSYFKIYLKLDFLQLFTSVTHKTINITSKSDPNSSTLLKHHIARFTKYFRLEWICKRSRYFTV